MDIVLSKTFLKPIDKNVSAATAMGTRMTIHSWISPQYPNSTILHDKQIALSLKKIAEIYSQEENLVKIPKRYFP